MTFALRSRQTADATRSVHRHRTLICEAWWPAAKAARLVAGSSVARPVDNQSMISRNIGAPLAGAWKMLLNIGHLTPSRTKLLALRIETRFIRQRVRSLMTLEHTLSACAVVLCATPGVSCRGSPRISRAQNGKHIWHGITRRGGVRSGPRSPGPSCCAEESARAPMREGIPAVHVYPARARRCARAINTASVRQSPHPAAVKREWCGKRMVPSQKASAHGAGERQGMQRTRLVTSGLCINLRKPTASLGAVCC